MWVPMTPLPFPPSTTTAVYHSFWLSIQVQNCLLWVAVSPNMSVMFDLTFMIFWPTCFVVVVVFSGDILVSFSEENLLFPECAYQFEHGLLWKKSNYSTMIDTHKIIAIVFLGPYCKYVCMKICRYFIIVMILQRVFQIESKARLFHKWWHKPYPEVPS